MRGDASTGHRMSSFFHQYVKHRGRVGNDSPNAGLNPLVWAPSVCLNVLAIWNAFTSQYTVCAIQVRVSTSVNYSSISMVTEGSTSSAKLPSSDPSSDSSHMSSLANKGFWDSELRFFKGK